MEAVYWYFTTSAHFKSGLVRALVEWPFTVNENGRGLTYGY